MNYVSGCALATCTLVIILNLIGAAEMRCRPLRFNADSIVCVCNASYCDEIPPIAPLAVGRFVMYTSTRSGLRFFRQEGRFSPVHCQLRINFTIDASNVNVRNESILGFGGSITDSAGLNILKLSEAMRNRLLESYYAKNGIEYSMGRIPMGATDFSKRPYSYAEIKGDVQLKHFQLKFEDYKLKIPVLKKALKYNPDLYLIASPWSSPYWMKTNGNYAFVGILKHEYYQIYANYYVKFLEKYRDAGVPVWGVTTGNEPVNGFWPLPLPILGWFTDDVAKWVRNNLGPTIKKSNFNMTKIIIHDDQKLFLPKLARFYKDDEALKYVDGVGVHWYLNGLTPKAFLNFAKTPKKNLFILGTEATNGFLQIPAVDLGSWSRAERYADDILDDLEYGAAGWIDWNIALDLIGGPVYTHFYADSTIIINDIKDEFYKQPTYYMMGHFSKFLPRGTMRIVAPYQSENYANLIRILVYKRPDNGIAVIIYNKSNDNVNIVIKDTTNGCARIKLRAKSINSLVYW